MMIVLVRWFIKPDQVDAFKTWWDAESRPRDPTLLFAEFLSDPTPQAEVAGYSTDALQPEFGEYVQVVNVAIWRDRTAFETVIEPKDNRPLLDFETQLPIRTILEPAEIHAGWWDIALPPRLPKPE
jgi:hypothetical protein